VSTTIPGAKTAAQAEENARASEAGALSEGTMGKIREIFDSRVRALVHPYW
jgi:aryl-alcohol dehydrogenase-like predicted oxidoreductase